MGPVLQQLRLTFLPSHSVVSFLGKGKGKGLHSYIRQRGQLSYSIKNQLQEEKEARLNKTPEKEARGNMKLMYEEEKNE
jgi:hypothetical protein